MVNGPKRIEYSVSGEPLAVIGSEASLMVTVMSFAPLLTAAKETMDELNKSKNKPAAQKDSEHWP